METTFPKTYVVLNPVAGTSDATNIRSKLKTALIERNIHFEIYETSEGENLSTVVRSAISHDFQLFFTVGGDGTVSGVAP